MFQGSDSLLFPLTGTEFKDSIYLKKASMINPCHKELLSVFNWRDFYQLLNNKNIPLPKVNLSLNGEFFLASGYDDALVQFKSGKTISIRSLEKYIPSLSELCRIWSDFFNARVSLNLYVSSPGNCGLGIHYDTHDIFIIQLHGRKKWMFFPETVKYPLPDIRNRPYAGIVPGAEDCYLETVLERGNIFYLPRGHWHQALAVEPSMHLAVAVRYLTGTEFFKNLLKLPALKPEHFLKSLDSFPFLRTFEGLITEKIIVLKKYETFISANQQALNTYVEDETFFRSDFPLIFPGENKSGLIEEHLERLFAGFMERVKSEK